MLSQGISATAGGNSLFSETVTITMLQMHHHALNDITKFSLQSMLTPQHEGNSSQLLDLGETIHGI